MKKITLFLFALFTCAISFSQVDINQLFSQHPEVIIKFQIPDRTQLETLTRMISIDNVTENEVIAYVVQEEFEQFLALNIPYEIVARPILTPEELNMLDFEAIKKYRNDWNYYPTYPAYLELLDDFVATYPDLCRKVEFGTTVQGRKLCALVLSHNVNVREAEPQVFWSSSMHGDETTGYVLMLRYIDYLLSNYGTDSRITYLLDNLEIWICPLANPDGTYRGGSNNGGSTINGATRANANNVDLNRNYKDWYYGDHPDYNSWQQETVAFMNLQANETFVLGVNIHGGSELCNYPWDNRNVVPADDAWWQYVCKEYADTVFAHAPSNYMKGEFSTGYIRGYLWYQAIGSRQDYANYYNHNREFTLEISNTKKPAASQLPNFWNYNYRSFLNYTQQALYGIHGVVTDACSGEPVDAQIIINNNTNNDSYMKTDPRVGYYARPIKGGTYSVTYSADGYTPQTVSITVADHQKVIQNISLIQEDVANMPVANFEANVTEIFVNETVQFTDISENATAWEWSFEGGTPETSTEQNPTVLYKNQGNFDVKLKVSNDLCSNEILMEDYITVNQITELPKANFEADKTELFENETVIFSNLSENATTWLWTFEGGTPETSTEQNPTVLYETTGKFSVTLKVTNDFGNDEMKKTDYIIVNPLAINEIEEINMKIFPNPVLHETSITIEADATLQKIELINILGATVKTACPNATPYHFSVSGIEKGIYLLRIETQKGAYVTKIQIQ